MFLTADISAATKMPASVINNLVRFGVAPEFAGGGKGRARMWDDKGFAVFCLIGAIYAAGVNGMAAARIGGAVAQEMRDEGRREIPDGINDLEREALKAGAELGSEDGWDRRLARFSVIHSALGDGPFVAPRSNDLVLEIVDRTYGFVGTPMGLGTMSPFTRQRFETRPAFKLVGWDQGEECHVMNFDAECAGNIYLPAALEFEYMEARKRAASVLAVNVSLAVRRGYLATIKGRAEKAEKP